MLRPISGRAAPRRPFPCPPPFPWSKHVAHPEDRGQPAGHHRQQPGRRAAVLSHTERRSVTFTVGQLVKALTLMAALVVVAVVAVPNLILHGAGSRTPAAVRTVTVTNEGPTAEAVDTRQAAYDKCLPLQAEFRANPAKFGIISV